MSGVFQNSNPPPPHRPASVYHPPRLWCGGRTHSLGGKGVEAALGGSIFWKTPDTALYSTYVSTLCATASHKLIIVSRGEKDYGTLHSTSRST
jgi:hypothetical protein